MAKYTPMMEQYLGIKKQYEDCILLYRLGDFYEMFFEDAITASKVLEIALTGRDCGQEQRAPMCGVPHHSVNNYISKLIENGFKVAICEQTEDASLAKGIVKRDVIRVITPGTIIDQNMLDEKSNNYLCSIYKDVNGFGMAYVDVSTGDLFFTEHIQKNLSNQNDTIVLIQEEINKVNPSEFISNTKISNNMLNQKLTCIDEIFSLERYKEIILNHFKIFSLDEFGISNSSNSIISLGMLIHYLNQTQKISLEHINKPNFYKIDEYLHLDYSTRKNLELTETIRGKKGQGTLYHILDNTMTAMGGRLLKKWVEEPLKNRTLINKRLDAVEELYTNIISSNNIKECLKSVYDIERLIGRIVYGNCNGRDLIALKQSIKNLPDFKNDIASLQSKMFLDMYDEFDILEDIYDVIETSIVEEPPISVKEGGIIKDGFNQELDEIREITTNGKNWISSLQNEEREKTGIKNLKIGYTKVFGYYLEVTQSYLKSVPSHYIRKQTLTNCERYVTPELKEMEAKILNADEQLMKIEYELFSQIRQYIKDQVKRIQKTAHDIAVIDVINALSICAVKNDYVRPIITNDENINIVDGRHPVVEKLIHGERFVPNDTYLDKDDNRMSIITGPNMAGKSTYMRQVALICLMSHMGSFVPAKEARICILDKIFTRVGASDDLSQGQSTFMVEMSEVSNILKNATKHSLLILDEIGRGTSTYDGLSIAWSVVEYITKKIKAKTLFATHYHELSELESKLKSVQNYRILIKEADDKIIFLRKIAKGSVDRSYGIQVASLAGLPKDVISRAKEILIQLDESDINKPFSKRKKQRITDNFQVNIFEDTNLFKKDSETENIDEKLQNKLDDKNQYENSDIKSENNITEDKLIDVSNAIQENRYMYKEFIDKIKNIDINSTTPIGAMTLLYEIIKDAKDIDK